MRRRSRASGRPPATLDQMISWYASPNVIPGMLANAARQNAKDRLLLRRTSRLLRPGTVLELGAGVGQVSTLLASMGFDVTASDIHPHLVAFMRSRGLKAEVVDARWIERALRGPFDNVLACGLHTLLTKDLAGAEQTYRSAFGVLRPGGRFIIILGNGRPVPHWCTLEDHLPLIANTGFEVLSRFREQVVPSVWYGRLPRLLLWGVDATAGRLFGIRNTLVLCRPVAPLSPENERCEIRSSHGPHASW